MNEAGDSKNPHDKELEIPTPEKALADLARLSNFFDTPEDDPDVSALTREILGENAEGAINLMSLLELHAKTTSPFESKLFKKNLNKVVSEISEDALALALEHGTFPPGTFHILVMTIFKLSRESYTIVRLMIAKVLQPNKRGVSTGIALESKQKIIKKVLEGPFAKEDICHQVLASEKIGIIVAAIPFATRPMLGDLKRRFPKMPRSIFNAIKKRRIGLE